LSLLVSVSILVLMEGASEHDYPGARKRRGRVSILVLMEGASEQNSTKMMQTKKSEVSILVLMEGASEQQRRDRRGIGKVSFNPCFNGRSFRTEILIVTKATRKKFQSLF